MSIFDTILLIILAGFTFYGLFFGLIRTIGSLLSIVAAVWLTTKYYLVVFELVKDLTFGYEHLGKIIVFILLFTLINRSVNLFFIILDRSFDFISFFPFLKTINRLAGAAIGFFTGALVLGFLLKAIVAQPLLVKLLSRWLAYSRFAPFLLSFNTKIISFLPGIFGKIKDFFTSFAGDFSS